MRISDWSSDVCSSDLAGLVVVTINTAGAEGVEARPRVDLVCQVARSVDHGERASVVVNERASEQAVVFAAHDAAVVVARLGVWCLRHGVSPSPSSGAMHAHYPRSEERSEGKGGGSTCRS